MSRKLIHLAGAAIGSVALLAASAVPASAADTVTTFELAAGTLDLAVAATATLTDGDSGATTISGSLGAVSVTDDRGGVLGWVTSAASSVFTGAPVATVSTAVSYNSGGVTGTGSVTRTSTGATALTAAAATVVSGTTVNGNNTAAWDPTLTVTLPSTSSAGTYTGTVTTSLV